MPRSVLFTAIALCLLVALPAGAQLNGTYTVGAGGTYLTLAAAVADLNAQGVSGPVNFVVTGSHAGPVTISAFAGQGAANPVTFSGAGAATLTGASPILTLSGCQYVTFDGFVATFAAGSAIVINGSYNTFKNCNFSQPLSTASTGGTNFSITGGTGVTIEDSSFGGGYEAFTSAAACNQLTFQRNRIKGGGWWIAEILGTDVTVKNNFIYGNSNYGLRAGTASANTRILNNSFYITQVANSSQYCAIRWYNTLYGEVINNAFYDTFFTGVANGFIMWCSGTLKPNVMNYNVYYSVNAISLIFSSSNQTLATWQALGYDANSVVADPLYTNPAASPPDLHVSASSPCFLTGQPNANVADDIDGQVRNPSVPTIGADEVPTMGLFASFTASPTTGPAALNVNFTDTSFTSDPMGVQSWAWDFQNDGINDAFTATPSFNYVVPGTYSVKLTVTDLSHPSSSYVHNNYITVGPYVFDAQTVAGTGSLSIFPVPNIGVPSATSGFMLVSFTPPVTLGSGPFFGLIPDSFTWSILMTPESVGNLLHWTSAPGIFPNVPLILPGGTLVSLIGLTADFVQVDLTPQLTIANISNLDRLTF